VANLGAVNWNVTNHQRYGSKKIAINARARAWQNQLGPWAGRWHNRQILAPRISQKKRVLIENLRRKLC